jgi:hypothetical protein
MVRQVASVIEILFSGGRVSSVDDGTSVKSKSKGHDILLPLGKDLAYYSSVVESELSEPECELDPLEVDTSALADDGMSLQLTQPAHSMKARKKRHSSLIDKALRAQQKQSQDLLSPPEPAYIRISDLVADWSYYTKSSATRSLFAPVLPTKDFDVQEAVDLHGASVSSKTKRNRKKSLIDKAALQQRRMELEMQQAKSINY